MWQLYTLFLPPKIITEFIPVHRYKSNFLLQAACIDLSSTFFIDLFAATWWWCRLNDRPWWSLTVWIVPSTVCCVGPARPSGWLISESSLTSPPARGSPGRSILTTLLGEAKFCCCPSRTRCTRSLLWVPSRTSDTLNWWNWLFCCGLSTKACKETDFTVVFPFSGCSPRCLQPCGQRTANCHFQAERHPGHGGISWMYVVLVVSGL